MFKENAKAYYWNTKPNFGDALTPLLLHHFADVKSDWAPVSHANVVVVGSVLEHIPPLWDGHILGAGRLYSDSRLHLYTRTATIWGLRGPLSAQGIKGDYALGDPGLLADELVHIPTRDIDLGIVPHHTDVSLAKNTHWYGPWKTTVISPSWPPLKVLSAIGRCKKIVTSSLHGMIVADAFNIPRRFELNPHATKYEGGLYKFQDYSASISTPLEPGKLIEASRFKVEDRRFEVYDAFRSMACSF